VDGMIFKTGNLTKPDMSTSVVENGNANYQIISRLLAPGLDFQSIGSWAGSSKWSINSGTATCSPDAPNVDYLLQQAALLTIGKYYLITLTISSNSNYLEDSLSILLGDKEYFVGSSKPGKEYKILGICNTNTNLTLKVNSKQYSKVNSSLKINSLKVEEVETTYMFSNSTWLNGTANGIHLNDSQWIDGTLTNGLFNNSQWINGTCNYGDFTDCNWKDGEWNDGVWFTFLSSNGKWENGNWSDGMFRDGEFLCGYFKGGIWEYGMFRDGSLEGNIKFYDGLFQYGNIRFRSYPIRHYNVNNIGLDQDGNIFNIEDDASNIVLQLTSKNDYNVYSYPSGVYTAANWGASFQPSWVSNFRSGADWSLDDPKIILRDVLDYHLNGSGNYSDNYDVDFVTPNDIVSGDLSGDGMTTSPNSQTSNFIRIIDKDYRDGSLTKSGNSNITASQIKAGFDDVHMLGGADVGKLTVSKIPIDINYSTTFNFGGYAKFQFYQDLTSYISPGDTISLYGTGKFNDDVGFFIGYKDGTHEVNNIVWTGSYTEILTFTPVTGVPSIIFNNALVEVWVDSVRIDTVTDHNAVSLSKYGRYFSYVISGDHTSLYKKDNEVVFTDINNATTLSYIKNNKIYNIKTVILTGLDTRIVLDLKYNSIVSTGVAEPITIKRITKLSGFNNFCLGGGGPGTVPPVVILPIIP